MNHMAPARRGWIESGIIERHWRGEIEPGAGLLRPVALFGAFVVLLALFRLFLRDTMLPGAAMVMGFVLWLLAVLLAVWLAVGLVRSGFGRSAPRPPRGAGYAAVLAAVVLLVLVPGGVKLARQDMQRSAARAEMSTATDAIIRPLNAGTELLFEGYIDRDAVNALLAAARDLPHVRLIHLESWGAELADAWRMRDLVKARGWDTATSNVCLSGCTLVLIGGERRYMREGARVGFHSAWVWPPSRARTAEANAEIVRDMVAHGVADAFAAKAMSQPNARMWFPPAGELLRAGVVDVVCGAGAAVTVGGEGDTVTGCKDA